MRKNSEGLAPFFSVIIPTYNVEKYITACVKSVINQSSNVPYEIICIDDCSTDRTASLITDLQKQYGTIRFVEKEKNTGVSDSRNIGIDQAKGEYILFVDGDDYIMPNTFEVCGKMMRRYNLDLLCFNATGITESGCFSFLNENILRDLPKIEEGYPEYLVYVTNIWLLCYRKSFLVNAGVRFSDKKIFEDWEFLWNLYPKANRVKFVKKALYVYRTAANPQSLTKQFHHNAFEFDLLINTYLDSTREMEQEGVYPQYEYACLQRTCEIFYHFFLKTNDSYKYLKKKICTFSKFLHIPHPVVIKKIISDSFTGFDYRIVSAIYRNSVRDRILIFCLHGAKAGMNIWACRQAIVGFVAPFKVVVNWFRNIYTLSINAIKASAKIFGNLCRKILTK